MIGFVIISITSLLILLFHFLYPPLLLFTLGLIAVGVLPKPPLWTYARMLYPATTTDGEKKQAGMPFSLSDDNEKIIKEDDEDNKDVKKEKNIDQQDKKKKMKSETAI